MDPRRISNGLRTLLCAGILAGAEQLCTASPPAPFAIVDRELALRPIRGFAVVGTATGDRLVVWPAASDEAAADPVLLDRDECLMIVAEGSIRGSSSGGILEYADGRRTPGSPRLLDGAIVWRHRWLGERALDFDSLRTVLLAPATAASAAPASTARGDEVLLVNGDRVEGIVQSIGTVVTIERLEGGMFEVPFERVARIALLAPDAPTGVSGASAPPRAWIADGTIVDGAPRLSGSDDDAGADAGDAYPLDPPSVLELSIPDESFVRPIEIVALRAFVPDRARFVPFARFIPVEARPSGELPRFALPVPEAADGLWPADVAPVVVRGPVRLRYRLPSGGCVFAARIVPHEPDPRWTDAELVLRDGGREVLRRRVAADMAPEWIRVPLASEDLEIEVTEGERGPVRDAVRFELAVIARPHGSRPVGTPPED